MNRPLVAALALGVCVTAFAAQTRFRYTDPAKNVEVQANRARVDNASQQTSQLLVQGQVDITSRSQGLRIQANEVRCEIGTVKANTKEIRKATATGSVKMSKTVTNARGRQLTEISGSKADMVADPKGSTVNMAGPVGIRSSDDRKRVNLSATGSSGIAILEPGSATGLTNGLREATLAGPVKIDMLQAGRAGQKGEARAEAKANRMRLVARKDGSTLTLLGNVEIHGRGASDIGDTTGLSKAIFEFNAAGEVTRFSTEAGG